MIDLLDLQDETDQRIKAWYAVARHPFLRDCYEAEGTLIDAILEKLDAAQVADERLDDCQDCEVPHE